MRTSRPRCDDNKGSESVSRLFSPKRVVEVTPKFVALFSSFPEVQRRLYLKEELARKGEVHTKTKQNRVSKSLFLQSSLISASYKATAQVNRAAYLNSLGKTTPTLVLAELLQTNQVGADDFPACRVYALAARFAENDLCDHTFAVEARLFREESEALLTTWFCVFSIGNIGSAVNGQAASFFYGKEMSGNVSCIALECVQR